MMIIIVEDNGHMTLRCSQHPKFAPDLGPMIGVPQVIEHSTMHQRAEHPAPAPRVAPDQVYDPEQAAAPGLVCKVWLEQSGTWPRHTVPPDGSCSCETRADCRAAPRGVAPDQVYDPEQAPAPVMWHGRTPIGPVRACDCGCDAPCARCLSGMQHRHRAAPAPERPLRVAGAVRWAT